MRPVTVSPVMLVTDQAGVKRGNPSCHDSRVLRPFVAYLRVYEPLSAFGDHPENTSVKAIEAAALSRWSASEREHVRWLSSQLSTPARLLPAEPPPRSEADSANAEVLMLHPEDVPVGESELVATEPLVCPLEIRSRSAAALSGFLDDAHPALRAAVLEPTGESAETARAQAQTAMQDLDGSTMHVLSTTWTVPLPWFTLIDPDERRLVLGEGPKDPMRELSWRTAMSDARRRATEAEELVTNAFGDSGPARILSETNRWLENFHPGSAVELDYGGLVQLIEDPVLAADASAEKVHRIVAALRHESTEDLADAFRSLRDHWSDIAARERSN